VSLLSGNNDSFNKYGKKKNLFTKVTFTYFPVTFDQSIDQILSEQKY